MWGADLGVLQQMATQPVEKVQQDSGELMRLYSRIYQFPKPVIAAVSGPAVGGGCGLLSVSDIVIAVEGATFAYPEVKVALFGRWRPCYWSESAATERPGNCC